MCTGSCHVCLRGVLTSGSYIQSSNLPLDYVSQFSKMYGIVENISSFDTHSEREVSENTEFLIDVGLTMNGDIFRAI